MVKCYGAKMRMFCYVLLLANPLATCVDFTIKTKHFSYISRIVGLVMYNLDVDYKPVESTLITPYSAGVDFSRHNLTSVDVRFSRLKSFPVL